MFSLKNINNGNFNIFWYLVAGIVLSLAFIFPDTWLSVVLGWVFCFLFVWLIRLKTNKFYLSLWIFGVVLHGASLYWLRDTLSYFGGFNIVISTILFLLFCGLSALQFVVFGWLLKKISAGKIKDLGFDIPIAWFCADLVSAKMFPWTLAHTQLRFHNFSALAEFLDTAILGALMLLIAEFLMNIPQCFLACKKASFAFTATAIFALFALGTFADFRVEKGISESEKFKVGLVQGNLEAKQKGNVSYLESNLETYRQLTKEVLNLGADLIIWPESVMTNLTPLEIYNLREIASDPLVSGFSQKKSHPILFGGLSVSEDSYPPKIYNTAFLLDEFGEILGRYHKQILMPFGEYLPFSDVFPFLKELSPESGDFTADSDLPLSIKIKNLAKEVRLGILICYEDLISGIASRETNAGADLLVNLTNDAWYGKTIAPYQHNMLAAWRAIENRKYLIRVTNTGLTSVIDARGKTLKELPIFQSGFLVEDVGLLPGKTFFSQTGNWVIWGLFVLLLPIFFIKSSPISH
jgi:apolipoprotein N-acyltransferase